MSDDAAAAGDDPLPEPALPEPARERVLAWAGQAQSALGPDELPRSLRPFSRFTPSRRARLSAPALALALEQDAGFRLRVAAHLREHHPELAALAGTDVPAADPADRAAVAYLLRPPDWPTRVAEATKQLRDRARAAEDRQVAEQVSRLHEQLAALRTQARAELDKLRRDLAAAKAENTEMRQKLHASRESRRSAVQQADTAREAAASAHAQQQAAALETDAEMRRLRARLAEAGSALDALRRSARDSRTMAEARVRLLLDTVVGAAQGLRRELALPPVAPDAWRPADAVAAVRSTGPGVGDVAERARAADDPAILDALLSLPQVHLLVDGYNVTKLGYGTLPLQTQRNRLVSGLAALAARSHAEVTVCFDGAAVEGVTATGVRGVRVLFSAPGETADELLRRLVEAEPSGRPLVVVSSDREVADDIRRQGARPVPSLALLRRLERG